MTDEVLKVEVIREICNLKNHGFRLVLVHGGGPFIRKELENAGIVSEFLGGHRVTTPEAIRPVEKALKGVVNADLVRLINQAGCCAVGLSGKDGKMVSVQRRTHRVVVDGRQVEYDLGRVGDIVQVDSRLLQLLLKHDYVPVLACMGIDAEGNEYNINADMFAGHIAGSLADSHLVVLTDVDGLMRDKENPRTLIHELPVSSIDDLQEKGIIEGGMIPKTEACRIALMAGTITAVILNGTRPQAVEAYGRGESVGTRICLP